MARHHDGIVADVEEVHFDGSQQAELVRILVLELLGCLKSVDKLSHVQVVSAVAACCQVTDAVYHLHLRSTNNASNVLRDRALSPQDFACAHH